MWVPTDCRSNRGAATFETQNWAIMTVSKFEEISVLEQQLLARRKEYDQKTRRGCTSLCSTYRYLLALCKFPLAAIDVPTTWPGDNCARNQPKTYNSYGCFTHHFCSMCGYPLAVGTRKDWSISGEPIRARIIQYPVEEAERAFCRSTTA